MARPSPSSSTSTPEGPRTQLTHLALDATRSACLGCGGNGSKDGHERQLPLVSPGCCHRWAGPGAPRRSGQRREEIVAMSKFETRPSASGNLGQFPAWTTAGPGPQQTLEDGCLGAPGGVRRVGRRRRGPHRAGGGIHAMGPGRRGDHVARHGHRHGSGFPTDPSRASRAAARVLVDAVQAPPRYDPCPVVGPAVLTAPRSPLPPTRVGPLSCRPHRDGSTRARVGDPVSPQGNTLRIGRAHIHFVANCADTSHFGFQRGLAIGPRPCSRWLPAHERHFDDRGAWPHPSNSRITTARRHARIDIVMRIILCYGPSNAL